MHIGNAEDRRCGAAGSHYDAAATSTSASITNDLHECKEGLVGQRMGRHFAVVLCAAGVAARNLSMGLTGCPCIGGARAQNFSRNLCMRPNVCYRDSTRQDDGINFTMCLGDGAGDTKCDDNFPQSYGTTCAAWDRPLYPCDGRST